MKSILHAALVAAAPGFAATAIAPAALAGVGVSINFGEVSVGYRDGYYDHHHRWHRWHHDNDWQSYRDAHPDNYRDYGHREHGHDHDHDQH